MSIKSLRRSLHAPIYRKRIEVLSALITGVLRTGDRVLDVGCGFGTLGRAVMDHAGCPADVTVQGLERTPRGNEVIPVHAYGGGRMPSGDKSFDVVTIADVLHHEQNPGHLLSECGRVARRVVVVKDHKPDGFAGQARISLMDWAANIGYDVPCLYRYPTLAGWHERFAEAGLKVESEMTSMEIYPPFWNVLFGNRLHYFGVLSPR